MSKPSPTPPICIDRRSWLRSAVRHLFAWSGLRSERRDSFQRHSHQSICLLLYTARDWTWVDGRVDPCSYVVLRSILEKKPLFDKWLWGYNIKRCLDCLIVQASSEGRKLRWGRTWRGTFRTDSTSNTFQATPHWSLTLPPVSGAHAPSSKLPTDMIAR